MEFINFERTKTWAHILFVQPESIYSVYSYYNKIYSIYGLWLQNISQIQISTQRLCPWCFVQNYQFKVKRPLKGIINISQTNTFSPITDSKLLGVSLFLPSKYASSLAHHSSFEQNVISLKAPQITVTVLQKNVHPGICQLLIWAWHIHMHTQTYMYMENVRQSPHLFFFSITCWQLIPLAERWIFTYMYDGWVSRFEIILAKWWCTSIDKLAKNE